MQPFTAFTGLVVPIDRPSVDTDAILPKQFMKSIERTGFGAYLFDGWRFLDPGEVGATVESRRPNPAFVLNQPRYANATILLGRDNFGCGSSREHAPWALADFGIRALIAASFADIFRTNCLKNGLLPIILPKPVVDKLFDVVARTPGYALHIDLNTQTIREAGGVATSFHLDATEREHLLGGHDEIKLTMMDSVAIADYEARRRQTEPWLFEAAALS